MAVRCAALFLLLNVPVMAFAAPLAGRRAVTTDECLAKGMCAYVSPKGRVTCGKCPGQAVRAIRFTKGTTAVCNDGSFARDTTPVRMCRAAGGIATRLTP